MFESLYDVSFKNITNHCDLRMYWHHLEKRGYSAVDSYRRLLETLGVLNKQPDQLGVNCYVDFLTEYSRTNHFWFMFSH